MDKDDYVRRLRRIEGQVRGLQRMVEEDSYCIDVLTQVSAVTKALQSVAVGLLDQHIRHCVSDAVRGDGNNAEEMIREATRAIDRLVKAWAPPWPDRRPTCTSSTSTPTTQRPAPSTPRRRTASTGTTPATTSTPGTTRRCSGGASG